MLALQGLNPTANRAAEPSMGCCPAKHRAQGDREGEGRLRARFRRDWDYSPRKLERVHFPAGGTHRSLEKQKETDRERERMKETHPRALGLSASERARGLPGLLQLEVIAPGGVGVVTATALPAPAEGGRRAR